MSKLAERVEALIVESEVRKMELQDGDLLVVYLPRNISDAEATRMQERIKEITKLDVKVFILPPGFDVAIIRQAGVTNDPH